MSAENRTTVFGPLRCFFNFKCVTREKSNITSERRPTDYFVVATINVRITSSGMTPGVGVVPTTSGTGRKSNFKKRCQT